MDVDTGGHSHFGCVALVMDLGEASAHMKYHVPFSLGWIGIS